VPLSRLLPAAKPGALDNPDTRDGVLRAAAREDSGSWHPKAAVNELVEVALALNRDFVKEIFFAEAYPPKATPDLKQSIVSALGKPPLNAEKRSLLRELLRNKRYAIYWTLSNRQGMGRDMCCVYAIEAVNAHAGKKAIDDHYRESLNDPE
jgi:hypothetical protein